MSYPNLLVISSVDYFHEVGPTANTLRSFLSSWQSENVRLLVCKDFNADKSFDNEFIYTLSHNDIVIAATFINEHRKAKSNIGFQGVTSNHLTKMNMFNYFKVYMRGQMTDLYQLLPYRFNRDLKDWLDDFHPHAIYLCVSNYRSHLMCLHIAKRYGIPIIPHFLDDWPNVQLPHEGFNSFSSKRFKVLFDSIMKRSPFGLCISDLMVEIYSKRYGKQFYSLMNSVPCLMTDSDNSVMNMRKFLYSGSLYLKRELSLLMICEALSISTIEDLEFNIYAPNAQWEELKSKFSKYPFVHYGGFLNEEQLKNSILNTDILVFAESFDPSVLEFSRLSLSTRVPEYLSSGKPILAIGPSVQGAIQYLEENNVAFVITEKSNIKSVLNDIKKKDLVVQRINNAKQLFFKNHTTCAQQEKFYNWIVKAINQRS